MPDLSTEYNQARKRALRVYNKKVAHGQLGTLPFLDDVLLDTEIVARENLGTMDIPLKKVIGTFSAGRSSSFAENFMPLLEEGTEFAAKWKALCGYQFTEGIRDPVKVYEYLNWYYVVEGNKRVSVLKYFDAVTISAEVIRLVPKYDENNESIKLYYEFLEFYKSTKISSIWLNRLGGYSTLLKLIQGMKLPAGVEESNRISYFIEEIYMPFQRILYELGGEKLELSTGDVFLRYFNIYKLHKTINEADVYPRLRALLEEIRTHAGYEDVDLNTRPEEVPEPTFISSLISIVKPKAKLRIAFAYAGSLQESNWAKAHENGRQHAQDAFGDDVQTSYVDNVPEDIIGAYTIFKDLISDGINLIFATSPAFARAALRTALEFPQVRIFVCSEQEPSAHVHTYFGRIYEARFLTGIIAGSLTKTNKIGYVGSYPVKGVISGINAFALGARMVNPSAKILVSWAHRWDFSKTEIRNSTQLFEAGADIISHQNTFTGNGFTGEYGLFSMSCPDCEPDEYIATPIWNWGIFYERIIHTLLTGPAPAEAKPMQFWWGLDSGIVDIIYAKKYVPLETHKLVGVFKRLIKEDLYQPFSGPIFDQLGQERVPAGALADAHQIISMDWFVEGIEGNIAALPANAADVDMTSELLEL